MERLSAADLGAFLTYLQECSTATDLDGFAARVLPALHRLIPSELTAYNEVDPRRGVARVVAEPPDDRVAPATTALARHLEKHPLVLHSSRTGDGRHER